MLNFDSINLSVLAVKYDLLALGATAVDELAYLPNFPAADTKTYMTRHLRVCGGLAGRALLTAAGMGLRCAYAGALDRSDRSAYVLASLVAGGGRCVPRPTRDHGSTGSRGHPGGCSNGVPNDPG